MLPWCERESIRTVGSDLGAVGHERIHRHLLQHVPAPKWARNVGRGSWCRVDVGIGRHGLADTYTHQARDIFFEVCRVECEESRDHAPTLAGEK